MAKSYQTLKDEEIVRVAKANVVESAAATFTQTEIDTQLSIERGVIWMIHSVGFFASPSLLRELAAGGNEEFTVQLTRESKSALVNFDNADLITMHRFQATRSAAIGTDAGPLYLGYQYPVVYNYKPALPYASTNLYLGLQSSFASPLTCYLRLNYTIRSVSDKYFFRVAQALLG